MKEQGKFQIKVVQDHAAYYSNDEYYLSITHNGYQWSTVRIGTIRQLRDVIRVLTEELKSSEVC